MKRLIRVEHTIETDESGDRCLPKCRRLYGYYCLEFKTTLRPDYGGYGRLQACKDAEVKGGEDAHRS